MEPNTTDTDGATISEIVADHPLTDILGASPRVRYLAALYAAEEPLTPARLAERADTSPATWYNHDDALLATGFVEQADSIGNSPRYQLAEDDPRVEAFIRFVDETSRAAIHAADADDDVDE